MTSPVVVVVGVLVSTVAQLLVWAPQPCHGIAGSLVVSVPGGLVQGTRRSRAVHFLGIPYGTAHRFGYPFSSVTPWNGIMNASHPGPQCPQHCPPVIRDLYCRPNNQMSESCLTLNIFRPAYNLPSDQAFPVMVFIHGGDFEAGSGGAPLYNGDYLARAGGVILVTINYRLGALGFLPIFNSYDDIIGNFGFRDQQTALQWVNQNIVNFDGDPNKVTLFGAEAGCQSVGLHLTSLTSNPLFHSAILHSCPFTIPFRSKHESHQMAAVFAKALGCLENDVNCLRQKSVQDILLAQKNVSYDASSQSPSLGMFQVWGPTVDKSNVYDSNLLEELTNAVMAKAKPIMVGFVAEEGISSVYRTFSLPVSNNFFERFVRSKFPGQWAQVAGTSGAPYHSPDLADARTQMAHVLNDFVYVCPAHRFAWKLANAEKSLGASPKLWMYKFAPKVTWSPAASSWPPGGDSYCGKDACQSLDLQYLFNPATIPDTRRGAQTAGLTRAMAFYWTNFAKYHNPNGLRDDNSAPSHSRSQTVQGSLARSRGVAGFSAPLQPASVARSQVPGTFSLPASLQTLLQGVAGTSKSRFFSFSSAFSPQSQRILGVPFMLQQALGGRFVIGSLFAQSRHGTATPPSRPSPGFVAWPAYVTQDLVTTSADVNATLVLTQPSPVARFSPFDNGCEFWDRVGPVV